MNSQKTSFLILVILTVLFSACGAASLPSSMGATAPSPSITAPPASLSPTTLATAPDLKITSYAATVRVQSSRPTSVSASCKPGEQLLGGGFEASDLFEFAASIEASWPSSATTWTVTGSAPDSYFNLEANVYCLSATAPVGMQIVQAEGTPAGHAVCPQGTVLLGGGFQSSQPTQASSPLDNGWSSASAGARVQVYALCAAQHIIARPVVTAAFNAQSSSHQYQPGGTSIACPTGQVATGGGFASQGDLFLASRTNGSAFAGWSVVAGGDADVTVYSVCRAFKG